MSEEKFGVIESSKAIDDRLELLHMEFAVEKMPEYSEYNMRQIWSENRELRKKILLCQREYIDENEQKNKRNRQYIDLLRVSTDVEVKYKSKIFFMEIEMNDMKKELLEAQQTIDEMKKQSGDQNDETVHP